MRADTFARAALAGAQGVKNLHVEAQSYFDLEPMIHCWRRGRLVATACPPADQGAVPLRALSTVPGSFSADVAVLVTEMVWTASQSVELRQPGAMQAALMDDPLAEVCLGLMAHAVSLDDQALAFAAYEYVEVDDIGVRLAWDDATVTDSMKVGVSTATVAGAIRASMTDPGVAGLGSVRTPRNSDTIDRFVATELRRQIGGRFMIDGMLVR